MDEQDALAARFEAHRPRLRAVARRLLGSETAAEDAVQETWLRLARSDAAEIEQLEAWLTTVVARVALDDLRARRARPEVPFELDRLSDPLVAAPLSADPAETALLGDAVGVALLVVLDALGPLERVAFVLHDLFGLSFAEIAPVVDRTPEAARQLASRARRRVRGAAAPA
ncbi:sigma-70 family RNA polymerase sigma factor, partial [Patulibacter sp. S7RM1-6]